MWKNILFDLDGTLTDPKEGITKSVRYALRAFGVEVESLDDLLPFIGPPLKDSFMRFYGFDEEEATEAVAKYREYYSETGIFENVVYDGVADMLQALEDKGKTIVLATSKPTVFAVQVLRHFGIEKYFRFVAGSELDNTRVKKAEVIAYALENCGIAEHSATVMVGDREHDIIGAKAVGLASIGVLYGYGDDAELSAAGAGRIVETVDELKRALLD